MLVTWTRISLLAKGESTGFSSIPYGAKLGLVSALAVALIGSVTAWAQSPVANGQDDRQVAQMAAGGPQVPSAPDSATGQPWQVVAVEGQAHVLVDDGQSIGWTAIRPGQELPGNSQIETGAGSQVLLFNGRDAITVGAETRLGLVETEADANKVEIFQDSGTADYQVEDRSPGFGLEGFLTGVSQIFGGAPEGRFEVRAPYLTTVVKGTAFTVTVESDNTEVNVSDGVVEVRDTRSGEGADIVAGQSATARSNPAAGVQVEEEVDVAFDPGAKAPPGNGNGN